MEINEYKKMYDLETTYWWYVGRRFIIRSLIRRFWRHKNGSMVDIGCGTGASLSLFKEFSGDVVGLDTSEEALAYCRVRGFNNVKKIEDASRTNLPDHSAQLVTLLDVLEHIKNEAETLKEIKRILAPEGLLLIIVPAYQFLWSEHDVALHHYRRYTSRGLASLLERNGYQVIKNSYAITFSFPIIVLYRVLKGIINVFYKSRPKTSHVELPKILNSFFVGLLETEATLLQYFNFPFGTSIVAVARPITVFHGQ